MVCLSRLAAGVHRAYTPYRTMKATVPPLVIAKPCPASWDDMEGDERSRFCSQCRLHVHNLSAMTAREQRDFAARAGGSACVAYIPAGDGRILTRTWRDRLRHCFSPLRWALATVLPVLFSGCAERASHTTGAPAPTGCGHPEKTVCGKDRDGVILLGFAPSIRNQSKPTQR